MELLLKLITLLSCTYTGLTSEHSQIIPVEHYNTELQELGQHVEIPETPVRVIKITKTIAVKVPVPYPVKVREKVPYPVHVAKPYPVPVPQIIKVPHVVNIGGNNKKDYGTQNLANHQGDYNSYQVQEHQLDNEGLPYNPTQEHETYGGNVNDNGHGAAVADEYSSEETRGTYGALPSSHGYGETNALESNNYNQAIQNYLANQGPNNKAGAIPYY